MPSITTAPATSIPSQQSPNQIGRPRVTFIHEVSYLDKPVFEIHEFPEGLSAVGWNVDFIDFDEDSLRSRQYRQPSSRLGAGYVSLSSVPALGSGILRRLVAVLVGLVWIPWKLFRWKPEVVVLYAVPTFGWQTVLAGRVLGIPVVYRAIDLSSEIRESRFGRLVSWAERCVARNATVVCSNTNQLTDHLRSLGAVDAHRVFPGFDRQTLEAPTDGSKTTVQKSLQRDVSVVFMGTLFSFAGLEKLVRLIAPMLRRRPEVTFRILGAGDAEPAIRNAIAEESVCDSIEMAGFIPYERLFSELSQSSVAVIPFDERALTHVALPGKVPQYVRAGLPVVATPLRGLQELLPEGSGVIYRTLDTGFIDAIEQLIDNSDARSLLVGEGNSRLDAMATWEIAISGFEAVLYGAIEKHWKKPNVG